MADRMRRSSSRPGVVHATPVWPTERSRSADRRTPEPVTPAAIDARPRRRPQFVGRRGRPRLGRDRGRPSSRPGRRSSSPWIADVNASPSARRRAIGGRTRRWTASWPTATARRDGAGRRPPPLRRPGRRGTALRAATATMATAARASRDDRIHGRIPPRHATSGAASDGSFGWSTAIARRVASGSRSGPLEPRGEDRVGIALDVHAGRASVDSTWLSATIAARRVRVA